MSATGRRQRLAAALLATVLSVAAAACVPDLERATSAPPTEPPPPPTAAPTTTDPANRPAPPGGDQRGPTGQAVTLAFGGDVHFEGVIASKLAADPEDMLDPVAPVLERADLAMVNLETAVTTGGDPAPKAFTFRAPASAFTALETAGVDVASMANNHGMDFGLEGLRDSLAAANKASFPVVGIGEDDEQAFKAYRTTIRGQRIAIIGATQVLDSNLIDAWTAGDRKPGLASAKQVDRLLDAVRAARKRTDTVVVYLHWGRELEPCPIGRQTSLAPELIKAGADVVVGAHAHRLLGGGWLDGAYVHYGLGNFVFYSRSGVTTRTGVLTLTVRGRAVTKAEWTPATISGGVPRPLDGPTADAAVAEWEALRDCTGLQGKP